VCLNVAFARENIESAIEDRNIEGGAEISYAHHIALGIYQIEDWILRIRTKYVFVLALSRATTYSFPS